MQRVFWILSLFLFAALPARGEVIARLAQALTPLEAQAARCAAAPERMVADCKAAARALGELDRLATDVAALRRTLMVEHEGYLTIAETNLRNLQANRDHSADLRTRLRKQDALVISYKLIAVMADALRVARALGITSADPADWTLNEAADEGWEKRIEIGLMAGKWLDHGWDILKAQGVPDTDVIDPGVIIDAGDALFNFYQLVKELREHGPGIFKRPAARIPFVGLVEKIAELKLKMERAAASQAIDATDKAILAEQKLVDDALARLARLNAQLAGLEAVTPRLEALRAALQACLKRLCPSQTPVAAPPSAPATHLAGAEGSLAARLLRLAEVNQPLRHAQSPNTAGLCQSNPVIKTDEEARRLAALRQSLQSEIDDLARQLGETTALIARLTLETRPGEMDLAQRARAELRIVQLQSQIDLRRAELTRTREAERMTLLAWTRRWQTNHGPVRITRNGDSVTIIPEDHIYNRFNGRYIVTDVQPSSISGEWVITDIDRRGAFHWCMNANLWSFEAWSREDTSTGGTWQRVVDGSLWE